MKKMLSCFELSEINFAPIPEVFFGMWTHNGSFHNPDYFLHTHCAHNERGARLMTRDEALVEAGRLQEECIRNQAQFDDWATSFKKGGVY